MSSTTDRRYIAPKYIGLLTSGITTAAIGAAGMAVLTTYGTHAPGTITPGWTAILATTCVIGSGLILTAWGLRLVMRRLAAIERKVDAHGRHVEREHGGLQDLGVDIAEQLAELRALVAEWRHHAPTDVEPEAQDEHGEMLRRILEKLAILTGGNVVDLDTVRAASHVNGRLPSQD